MATWTAFNAFKADVANGLHALGSDTLKIALSNAAPSTTADGVFADIAELSAGAGYSAGGATVTVGSSAQTAGVYSLVIQDVTFTASGGNIGPFRYAVLYNDSAAADQLIATFDYGTTYTLTDGNTFTIVANASGVIRLA